MVVIPWRSYHIWASWQVVERVEGVSGIESPQSRVRQLQTGGFWVMVMTYYWHVAVVVVGGQEVEYNDGVVVGRWDDLEFVKLKSEHSAFVLLRGYICYCRYMRGLIILYKWHPVSEYNIPCDSAIPSYIRLDWKWTTIIRAGYVEVCF